MNITRIGVIGCGHWGPNHVRVFSQFKESRVVACSELDARRTESIREAWPHILPFADHRKMLRDVEMDAVVIATPTRTHHKVVRDALMAGKHVLCEKPLAVSVSEASELVSLAKSRELVLMIGHVFLHNSGILRLKEMIEAGEPGRIYYLRAQRTNLGPVRRDVNSVFDLATHDIAIFNYLLGTSPRSASAVGGRFLQREIEDVAFVSLRYPHNVLAHILVSWLDPKKVREIVVVGDKKMVIWDDLAVAGPITIYDKGIDQPQDYSDFGQFQLLMREGDVTIPKLKQEEPLKVQNRFFLQCVREGHITMNGGVFALGVQHVLDAIQESLRLNGATVDVA